MAVRSFQVKVGQVFDIKLISNASTGYINTPMYDQNYVQLVGMYHENVSTIPGSPHTEIFRFLSIHPTHRTRINFLYHQPWITDIFPANIKTYYITITN